MFIWMGNTLCLLLVCMVDLHGYGYGALLTIDMDSQKRGFV